MGAISYHKESFEMLVEQFYNATKKVEGFQEGLDARFKVIRYNWRGDQADLQEVDFEEIKTNMRLIHENLEKITKFLQDKNGEFNSITY